MVFMADKADGLKLCEAKRSEAKQCWSTEK